MTLEDKKPQVKDAKAADPGLGFILYMNDNSAFSSRIFLTVTVTTSQGTYNSTVNINQNVTEKEVTIIVPFGDPNWDGETGKPISFSIGVTLPEISPTPYPAINGAVMADQSTFTFGTDLPQGIFENESPLVTNGQFMMSSEDNNYVGVLDTNGNFSVFQQCVIDSNTINPSQSTKSKNDNSGPWQVVSLIVSNGTVYIMNGSTPLYHSNESLDDSWFIIDNGAMYLKNANGSQALSVPFYKV